MSKEPVTIRLEEDLLDELDAEADAEGRSRSEYIRQLLRERHDETEAELKSRISRLESAVFGPNTETDVSVSGPNTGGDSNGVLGPNTKATESVSGPNTPKDVVSTLKIPGDSADEKRARASWLASTLSWMADRNSVRKGDVVARWEEGTLGYETADGLWESLVKPRLDELVEREVVEKPHSRAYRWVGQ
jgi:Arc/MetJ-type ribon-helix-helix transcriptional regulator